jgi:hypothetical protein
MMAGRPGVYITLLQTTAKKAIRSSIEWPQSIFVAHCEDEPIRWESRARAKKTDQPANSSAKRM